MTYTLFTVTVTAVVGSVSLFDGDVLSMLASALTLSGVLDVAITADPENVSFTGQVEAPNALAAINQACTAMVLAGFPTITSINADQLNEEADAYESIQLAV